MKLHRFTVYGRVRFPLDMLRHDACWPEGSQDAVKIESTIDPERRGEDKGALSIGLLGVQAPTIARWESFMWKCSPGAPRG